MKIVPVDSKNVARAYTLGKNQRLVMEFVDSNYDCVKVEGYPHKTAKSCQSALIQALNTLHIRTVKVIVRKGDVILLKVNEQ